jgi:hypothetical protein
MIAALEQEDPALYATYKADLRAAEGESAFIRTSGKYPLCGRGDVNTYAVFAELARQVLSPLGRAGVIVPSGIATDDTTKFYFQDIMETGTLASLYDFENRRKLFPAVDSRMKFCLLTLAGAARSVEQGAQFVFFALDVADLRKPERRFTAIPAGADVVALSVGGDRGGDCRPDPPHGAELPVGRVRSGHGCARPPTLLALGAAMADVRTDPGVGRNRSAPGGRPITALPVMQPPAAPTRGWPAAPTSPQPGD